MIKHYEYKGTVREIKSYDNHRNPEELCERILAQLKLEHPVGEEIILHHDVNGMKSKSYWKCMKMGFKRIG